MLAVDDEDFVDKIEDVNEIIGQGCGSVCEG